jgi:response regulator RpfG family c-di-GMP phosphodiesterase
VDAWLERSTHKAKEYVRPTLLVLDHPTPNALSNRKLGLELAKFNVLTAFSAAEMLATAIRYDVDGFVVDSVMVEPAPCELCQEIKRLHGRKPLIVIGDAEGTGADHVVDTSDTAALLECALRVFGEPKLLVLETNSGDRVIG